MTLRSEIVAVLEKKLEASRAAWDILMVLEDQGLSLFGNGWLEHDDDYEEGCNYFGLTQIIKDEPEINLASLKIISALETMGLGLEGNGWLDDDEEAVEFLEAVDLCE
jgi:hypothetical protein